MYYMQVINGGRRRAIKKDSDNSGSDDMHTRLPFSLASFFFRSILIRREGRRGCSIVVAGITYCKRSTLVELRYDDDDDDDDDEDVMIITTSQRP